MGSSNKAKANEESFTVERDDELYRIFERHLYEFNYESQESFVHEVVEEYIEFLAAVPHGASAGIRAPELEQVLAEEVSDMLIRKIYGCLDVVEGVVEETSQDTPIESQVFQKAYYQTQGISHTHYLLRCSLTRSFLRLSCVSSLCRADSTQESRLSPSESLK